MVSVKRGSIIGGAFIIIGLAMWILTDTSLFSNAAWSILVMITGIVIILTAIGEKLRAWIGFKD